MHDINEIRERFTTYLDAMFNKYNFADAYMDAYDCESMYGNWDECYDMEENYGTWFATGCTRFIVGDENYDYIIKLQKLEEEIDYCSFETNTYKRAEDLGFADKFAWTDKLMDYTFNFCGRDITIPIYVMECVECNYAMVSDDSYAFHYNSFCEREGLDPSREESRSVYYRRDGNYCSTEAMLEFAFATWSSSLTFKEGFIRFLRNERINDLHCGNWGYRNGGILVLTDYAGYGTPESRSDIRI